MEISSCLLLADGQTQGRPSRQFEVKRWGAREARHHIISVTMLRISHCDMKSDFVLLGTQGRVKIDAYADAVSTGCAASTLDHIRHSSF